VTQQDIQLFSMLYDFNYTIILSSLYNYLIPNSLLLSIYMFIMHYGVMIITVQF